MRDYELEESVKGLYSAKLPYHNFNHALDTIKASETILAHCREEGIRIDEQVVYYALLFHDAGYEQDHTVLGYRTKELYSCALASEYLSERSVPGALIDKVVKAILSTERDAQFKTVEQKAVRAADLSGLAADYATFRQRTEELSREHALMTGEEVPWSEWIERATDTISFYLGQEIRLTSYFYNAGESSFHKRVRENLQRLHAE